MSQHAEEIKKKTDLKKNIFFLLGRHRLLQLNRREACRRQRELSAGPVGKPALTPGPARAMPTYRLPLYSYTGLSIVGTAQIDRARDSPFLFKG